MSINAVPHTIEDVNAEWLSSILDNDVTGYEVTFLEGGVLSDAYKIHDIKYNNPADNAPSSLVLKIANVVEDRRAYALANRAYIKELRFFSQLADEVPLRTPHLYHIVDDGSPDAEFFVIAMEDLTAHSLVFDQVDDPPNEAFIRKIDDEVAEFHAKYWESDVLKLDWLRLPEDKYQFPLDGSCRAGADNFPTFLSLWQQMFNQNPLEDDRYPEMPELCDILTGPKCSALVDYMNAKLDARPKTLVHGDLRADNIFRTHPDKALSEADSTLTYIDWQILQPGPPGPEFTQSWQHSLAPEIRRKDKEFLKAYHDKLVDLCPQAKTSYPYDMLVEDYKIAFVLWWLALITLGVATIPIFDQPEGQRMKALWGQGLNYSWQAIQDHDCLDMVKGFVADIG